MKSIPLTQGQEALVDDHWYAYLSQWEWLAKYDRKTKSYYVVRKDGKSLVCMHRVIMKTPKGLQVDHINHDTLDNQEINLRNVTASVNSRNKDFTFARNGKRRNKLGVTGVFPHHKQFEARVKHNGKYVFRKTYKTIEEASRAYQDKVAEILKA